MNRFLRLVVVMGALLWVVWGSPGICGEEDYVTKKGLEVYQKDLQGLVQQILALSPSDRDQREFLDRLFQLKYAEAERLFDMIGQGDMSSRHAAEICVLKAVENHALGNRIQAYFALEDAESWNAKIRAGSVQIAGKPFDVASFSEGLEKEMFDWGANVRFVIKPFPQEKMFRPDKVVLTARQVERRQTSAPVRPERRVASIESDVSTSVGTSRGGKETSATVTDRDREFLSQRLRKALYKYYYNCSEASSEFSLYLPQGAYSLRDKEFSIHPVDFEVWTEPTQVVLKPGKWFRLTFSEDVHPSQITVLQQGAQWTDLNHVPFGKYRIEVRNPDYTYSFVKVTFAPKGDGSGEPGASGNAQDSEAYVAVDDRGSCQLRLRERDGNEKLRYSLLGY